MENPVTIDFSLPDLQPPVFIFTSLSNPRWEGLEMEAEQTNNGWHFRKSFDSTPGRHQYKFRLGLGDWWACDNTKPIGADDKGNPNNIIVVPAKERIVPVPVMNLSDPVNAYEGRPGTVLHEARLTTKGTVHSREGTPELDVHPEELHTPSDTPLFRHERLSIRDSFDARQYDEASLKKPQEVVAASHVGSESDEIDSPQPIRHATLRIFKEQLFPVPERSAPSGSELPTVEEHVGNYGYTSDHQDDSENDAAPDVLPGQGRTRFPTESEATIPRTQPTALLLKQSKPTADVKVVDLRTSNDGRPPKQSLLSSL